MEEKDGDWMIELGSDYEELTAFINCFGSVDVYFFLTNFEC